MRLTVGSSSVTYIQCAVNGNALLDICMFFFNLYSNFNELYCELGR